LIVFLLLTLKSISQENLAVIDSVTCLPNNQLRAAIKKIENAKIIEQENAGLKMQNATLLQRIDGKDKRIANFEEREKQHLFVRAQDSITISQQRVIIVAKDGQIVTYKRKWKAAKGWGWVKAGGGAGLALLLGSMIF
jgi:hypothetical protein